MAINLCAFPTFIAHLLSRKKCTTALLGFSLFEMSLATIDSWCFVPLNWTHLCIFAVLRAGSHVYWCVFFALSNPDNTAGIRTQRSGFNRHEQNMYLLPIRVVDSGPPPLSSTGTLTIYVCSCDTGERAEVGAAPLLALSPSKAATSAAHERSSWAPFLLQKAIEWLLCSS